MRHALYLPPFGELSDPRTMIDVAVAAEESGWDGVFLWDHILRWGDGPAEVPDTWTLLAALATVTSRIRFGPMVTPPARRRPHVVARQATSLDHLSGGRMVLGLGLGVDHAGELSKFGEVLDERERGRLLDEAAAVIASLFSGESVSLSGTYFHVDDATFAPRPVQSPRVPMWFAARGDARRPVRRAAGYDGIFPVEMDGDQLSRALDVVATERGGLEDFDVATIMIPGMDLADLARRGATWAMWSFLPGATADQVMGMAAAPPSGPRDD